MSRPSKLTPAVVKAAAAYVDGGWKDLKHAVPLKEGLALQVGISTETARVWALTPEKTESETEAQYEKRKELHSEFSAIVSRLNATKTLEALNGGLRGKFAAKIVGMIVARDGYSERIEQDITTKDKPISLLAGIAPKTLVVEDDDDEDSVDGGTAEADHSSNEDQQPS